MSDYCFVEAKVKIRGFFVRERKEMLGGGVMKVSELEKVEVKERMVKGQKCTSFQCGRRLLTG